MSYVVEMTAQARTDLRSIYEYIAFALQSRINADRQLDCIEREITGSGHHTTDGNFSLQQVAHLC